MKNWLFVLLFCYSFLSEAIVKDTLLYENDFSNGVGQEFSFQGSILHEKDMNVICEITPTFGFQGNINLTIPGIDLYSFDSVIVTYNIESKVEIIDNWGDVKFQNYIDQFLSSENVIIIDRYSITQLGVYKFDAVSREILLHTNGVSNPILTSEELKIMQLDLETHDYILDTCYTFDEWNHLEAPECFCNSKYGVGTNESNLCWQRIVFTPDYNIDIQIRNLKVVGYKTELLTSLKESYHDTKQIIATYNVLGEKIDSDTIGQLMIVKYSDGSTERIFNQ